MRVPEFFHYVGDLFDYIFHPPKGTGIIMGEVTYDFWRNKPNGSDELASKINNIVSSMRSFAVSSTNPERGAYDRLRIRIFCEARRGEIEGMVKRAEKNKDTNPFAVNVLPHLLTAQQELESLGDI